MTALNEETLPVPRSSIPQLAETYNEAVKAVRDAFATIQAAQDKLNAAFGVDARISIFDAMHDRYGGTANPKQTNEKLKRATWRVLVERLQIRRILSIKRVDELDKQIESGEGLPEITTVNLYAMLDSTIATLPQMIEEATKEIFDWLRPWQSGYKTNDEWQVGKKVILEWCVEPRWRGEGWQVKYQKQQHLRALDNVFHMLDGKGTIKSHQGPLYDAIYTCGPEARGETEYFKFKCYGKGTLHLEFKRLDLVARLNQVAGGMRLRAPAEQAA